MSDTKPAKTRKKAGTAEAGPPAQPAPRGRPSTFSQEVADEIIARLSKGEPLEQICRDDNMPTSRTVSNWKKASDAFNSDFVRAREEGFDAIAASCLEIADFGLNDTYLDDDGNKRTDTDVIQRSKLRIETRFKLLSKWYPKKYGDRVDVNHGGQGDNPLQTVTRIELVPMKK